MKKLTIKELAPYLPYGIDISINGKIQKLNSIDSEVKLVCYGWGAAGFIDDDDVKPLLRPLYQLTQEIEHNGERFVPLDELTEGETVSMSLNDYAEDWDSRTHYCFKRYVEEWVKGDIHHLDFLPYGFIEKLFEWHFDVFGLIDRGLALPIDGKEVKS